MKLGPGDECAAGHGPAPRKIEAFSAGTTCPSRDRDKGQGEAGREVGIPSACPVKPGAVSELHSVWARLSLGVQMGFGSSWALAVLVEGEGTGRAGAGTDLSEINMHLLWRPLGAALAQRRIIHSSHSF